MAGATWTPGQHHKADPRQPIPIYRAKSKNDPFFFQTGRSILGNICNNGIMASYPVRPAAFG